MMTTFIFLFCSIVGIPLGIFLTRMNKRFLYACFVIMVAATCKIGSLSITFCSREYYRMATRGFEIHLTDLCAVILLGGMLLRPKEYKLRGFIPLIIPYIFYLFFAWVSWGFTEGKVPLSIPPKTLWLDYRLFDTQYFELSLYPLFEISKVLRGIFLMWVTAQFMQDEKAMPIFIKTVVFMIIYLTIEALKLRYINKVNRVDAGMEHPNNFNTYIGMLSLILFPKTFGEKNWGSYGYFLITIFGLLSIILTISRSALAAFLLCIFLGFAFCIVKFPNKKNILLAIACLFLSLGFIIKASDTLFERFFEKESIQGSLNERNKLNNEAYLMAKHRFFGVGLGNFSAWSLLKYAELSQAEAGTLAHNIWFLSMAEVGFIGFITFIVIWIRFFHVLTVTFFHSMCWKKPEYFTSILGIFLAFILLQAQSLFHFCYRQTSIFFLLHIIVGITIHFYYQTKSEKQSALTFKGVPNERNT